MKIKFKKLHKLAVIPKQGSKYAACFDLVASSMEHDDNIVKVGYGLALELPEGYKAVIVPRSSFSGENWIMANTPGQIDPDYRGELMSKFEAIPIHISEKFQNNHMLEYACFPYKVGDRVAQLFIERIVEVEFEETEKLTGTERGQGGFGSTGK